MNKRMTTRERAPIIKFSFLVAASLFVTAEELMLASFLLAYGLPLKYRTR